ncbi:MAG: phosphomannomutase/phosphoglucomutase [Nocardioidaceae bacterium]|nr:phosphomannomutase/phosphoglucomutase [Nocardioidaceae bacterium]
MADLTAIFKAYDVRGLVPEQLDEPTVRMIGVAFATEVGAAPGVVVGHDMRASSPGLAAAFADGVRDTGANVTMIGLASTDELYFASGRLAMPGAMITASHNAAAYNGIKLCRAGAVALAEDTGLRTIRELVSGRTDASAPASRHPSDFPVSVAAADRSVLPAASGRGTLESVDLLADYASYLHELVSVRGRRLHVVVDAGNGMAGRSVPAVFAGLDIELSRLYFELDGTFPHHDANPLDPSNLLDLRRAVVDRDADLGLAFDGDADRCFVVDERGEVVSPSALTALIAIRMLAVEPGAHIIHNAITSRAVPEAITRHGGVPVRTRVGHSLIKATMAEIDAVFGGEHSGHFYFRDFWYADSGMLAALHLLSEAAQTWGPVSELVADLDPYVASGEINSTVPDTRMVIDKVRTEYDGRSDVQLDWLDGLTISGGQWWFNVRASKTEPVLRLNVEADTFETMIAIRDQVLALMRRPQ